MGIVHTDKDDARSTKWLDEDFIEKFWHGNFVIFEVEIDFLFDFVDIVKLQHTMGPSVDFKCDISIR